MSLRSFTTIVASPRPRVGKTLVARLLADFHLDSGRSLAAFDINGADAALTQFLPDHSAPADVAEIHGQMALFDRLVADDGSYKIVDLGHPAFKTFFAVAREIDLAAEMRRRGLAAVILFIATPDATSVEAYAQLRRNFPHAAVIPVHNEILGVAQHRDKFAATGPGSVPVHVATLAPGLRRVIERRPFSFAATRSTPPLDVPLETYLELKRWLRKIYVEFREMELRVLLGDLQSSLAEQPPQSNQM
jgi:hypothetical protein